MSEKKLKAHQVDGRRVMLGLTKYRIAKEAGIDEAYLGRVLRGLYSSQPVLKKAWAFMDAYEAEQREAEQLAA